jgi:hypothetical protein
MEQSPSANLQFSVGDIGYAFNNDIGIFYDPFTSGAPTAGLSVARLITVIKMYIYYDKSTCNKNMIRPNLQFSVGDIGYAFNNDIGIFYDFIGKMYIETCFRLRSEVLSVTV